MSIAPEMSAEEVAALTQYLSSAKMFLEFGCGGSTVVAASVDVPRMVSIDSSRDWLGKVGEDEAVARGVTEGRFVLHHADIGPLEQWGYPLGPYVHPSWAYYSTGIWHLLPAPPDLVLVDGRFRVSCGLQSMIHGTAETLILVHDFDRPHYHLLLRHADLVEQIDRLAVLRRKPSLDALAFAADCVTAIFDPN